MTAPPFVGLTGGIGAGKSEALAALERLGAATISTDGSSTSSTRILGARRRGGALGCRRSRPEGVVDRRRGGARSRSRPTRSARWLEGLLWPRVGQRVAAVARARVGVRAPRALVVETPLLFEAGLEGNYDATIAIVADEAVRAERAGARGHEALDERTARQLTQAEKAARATYAVENSGTLRESGAGAVGGSCEADV